MIPSLLAITFLLPTLLSAQLTQTEWQWQNPLPTGSGLESVAIGDRAVVAVGDNGTILLSRDRGITWSAFTLGSSATWYDVDMIDGGSGLIVGMEGRILRTTDDGASWRLERSAAEETLGAVALVDSLRAVAVGSRPGGVSVAIRTTDGGASWSDVAIPEGGGTLRDVMFRDTADGWISGNGGALFRTTDGGASWSDASLPTTVPLIGVDFYDERRGAAVGEGGTLFVTDDGGETWTRRTVPISTDHRSVAWIDTLRAVVTGANGGAETTDGGATWHLGGPGRDFRSVDVKRDLVIAVGVNGQVSYRTDTAGWVVASRHVMTSDLRSVEAFDRDRLIVTGGGYAATSSDGGATWKNVHMGLPRSVVEIALGAEGLVVGIGSGGATARSTDFGSTWTNVSTGAKRDLRDVDMADVRHGVAVGPGTILTTHDGGASWQLDTTTVTQILYSCAMLDSTTGFLAGTYGLIMRTTDGGVSWEKILTETSEYIVAIDFRTRDTGWFMTRFELFATADGGATWSRTPGPAPDHHMQSADFLDMRRGWITTLGPNWTYHVWRTTDGGARWTYVPHDISSLGSAPTELTGIRFLDDTTGWVVGGKGAVLRYRPASEPPSSVLMPERPSNATPDVALYPNPTRGLVTVRLTGGDRVVSVSLSDASGRRVDAPSVTEGVELPASSVILATQGLARGVYYLRVLSERREESVVPVIVD